MPYFDFKCRECGKVFELYYKQPPKEVKCSCGHYADRQISMPNIVFKGKGFYKTDSKAS